MGQGASMNVDKNGGPAFPAQFFDERATGMTLRDYFAVQALPVLIDKVDTLTMKELNGRTVSEVCAITAYDYADAMLLEARK